MPFLPGQLLIDFQCGIYRILNTVSGDSYVGSSCAIDKRWAKHRKRLDKGEHENERLQRAWLKYGKTSFVFEVVTLCPASELEREEQRAIDALPREARYNLADAAGSPMRDDAGSPARERHRRAMAELAKDPAWLAVQKRNGERRSRDPAWRKKNADAIARMAASREWREAQQAGVIARNVDPAYRAALAAGIARRSANNEWRKRLSDAMKQSWEKRKPSSASESR